MLISTRSISLALVALVCVAGSATLSTAPPPAPTAPAVYRFASAPQTAPAHRTVGSEQVSGTLPGARALGSAFADVAAAVTPAVVQIRTERTLADAHGGRLDELFERLPEGHPPPETPHVADGSGFLVGPDGLILTNHHVVAGASHINVLLRDRRVFEGTLVGADPTTDLALIAIEGSALPHVELGDSESLRVGEWVLAIGNPGFRGDNTLDFTVTSGIVSAKGRPLNVIQDELLDSGHPAARYAIEDFIQTDAAINPGNSGGPLVDLDGRVVGVNTAIASSNGVSQGYGFAVPVNVARRVMRDLLEHGYVRRPLLGISIQTVDPEDAEVYGLPRIGGVLIEDFSDDSPAERGGLRRHDVIVGLEGRVVDRPGQLQRLVAAHEPGETVRVDVVRFGERLRFDVVLTEADLGGRRVVRTAPEPKPTAGIGLELADLTAAVARDRRFREPGGALVVGVRPGSPADRKQVRPGFALREINRERVSNAAEAERMLRALPSDAVVSLLLEDPRGTTYIRNIRIP
jgi:serine protease Do